MIRSVSTEGAFLEMRKLAREGRIFLVIAGVAVLIVLLLIVFRIPVQSLQLDQVIIASGFVLTLGVAGPGLTLYFLRWYTDMKMMKGTGKMFSAKARLALISINWVVLAVILVLLLQFGVL